MSTHVAAGQVQPFPLNPTEAGPDPDQNQKIEKTEAFDYGELEPEIRDLVKNRAESIRGIAKQTAMNIVSIGGMLAGVKEKLKHGQWLPWLKHEFSWSRQTADNFIRVYEQSKLLNFSNLEIDVSALYLITSPSTPEPVRREVIERAKAGEPMTNKKAVEILSTFHKKHESPPPALAAQIAAAIGEPIGEWWEKHWGEDMPEYVRKDLSPFKSLIVHFARAADMEAFAQLINQKITAHTRFIYYPAAERRKLLKLEETQDGE